jgi:PTH1 family peptidyl-tRNA hydrolase
VRPLAVASERVLLAGLGNPGPKYASNRHNIGFMAIDAIIRRFGFGAFRARLHGEIAPGRIAGRDALALKPLTYMNESGRSVAEAVRFYKVPLADLFVFHDDLDLAAGKVRVKRGGGAAGHNGLRSIDAHLGSDYSRVRLGIGHPGDKRRVLGHVLDDFDEADRQWLDPVLDAVAEHVPLLIEGDAAAFASKVALALNPPRPKPERTKNPLTPSLPHEGAGNRTRPGKGAENGKSDQPSSPSPSTGEGSGEGDPRRSTREP